MAAVLPKPPTAYTLKYYNETVATEVGSTYGALTITSSTYNETLGLSVYTGSNSSRYCTYTIYGTPQQAGTWTISFKYHWGNTSTWSTGSVTLTISNCAPGILGTSPLASASKRVRYACNILAYGSTNMTCSIIDGELPPGLSITNSGIIRGYPDLLSMKIDEVNFPDENFRNYIKTEIMGDANATELSTEKRALTTSINVSGRNIADLTGIEWTNSESDIIIK